jgi:hypothetical protein
MAISEQPRGDGWTVVLRRLPVRVVDGHADGPYTDTFEIICCSCGDDPDLDYSAVSPSLQLVRGPYSIAKGVAAYEAHLSSHAQTEMEYRPGR